MRYLLCLCIFFLSVLRVFASHSTLRVDPFNTLPDSNTGAFRTNSQTYWEHESAQILGRYAVPFVFSGGLHGTSSTLVSAIFATEAYVPERVNQTGTAITYAAVATDTCWTIVSSDNNGITGWTRVGTTAYYYQCEGDGTPNQPLLPLNSAWLMQITVTGSALTTVADLREMHSHGIDHIERFESFNAAIDEYDDSGDPSITLVISSRTQILANVTVPLNVTLIMERRGVIDIPSGITLTINGPFQANPFQQVFSGAGTTVFGTRSVQEVSANWFGAVGDGNCETYGGATNNTTALNAAVTSLPSATPSPAILFPGGCYHFATSPTLGRALILTGPGPGSVLAGGVSETPRLVYGGTGVFLVLDKTYMSIAHLAIRGNSIAGTTGIDITAAHSKLHDISVENFSGAGSFGIRCRGTTVGVNECNYSDWSHLWVRSNQSGIVYGGAPTGNNFCFRCISSGNASDGLRIEATTNVLYFFGDLEGNCTSGATCYDLNIVSGRWIHYWGWTENSVVARTLFLPTCSVGAANYYYIHGFHSGTTNHRTALLSAAANGCTYYMDAPYAYATGEPSLFTTLIIPDIRYLDNVDNSLQRLLNWQQTRGNIILGSQSIRTPSISLRRDTSLANEGTLILSNILSYASPLDGLLLLHISTDNVMCEFFFTSTTSTEVREIPAGGTFCTNALGSAASINVYYTGGLHQLQNLRGSARNIGMWYFGAE